MHLFMQYCDYSHCSTDENLEQELQRLLQHRFLSAEQGSAVELSRIAEFFASPWGKLVTGPGDVRREFKFSVLVDSSRYFPEYRGESIMLQGVVDCFVITKEGIVVLDYKTDRIKPGTEMEKTRDYLPQLQAYSEALERIFGIPVIQRIVYFFATGTACEI